MGFTDTFKDNEQMEKYEVFINRKLSKIEYMRTINEIYLTHTEVALEKEGNGIGKELIEKILQTLKSKS
jgi:predicted GNAT family acetyltransferase